MAIPSFLIRFNAARPAVDSRGVFTKEIADALTRLFESYNTSVEITNEMAASADAGLYAAVALRSQPQPPVVIAQPAVSRAGPSIILQR